MVNEPNDPHRANDPYRANDPHRANDLYRPSRSNLGDDDVGRDDRLERELQADPELAEGPANGAKIAMFALGVALILGAVFYGLNNTSVHQAGTSSTAQNSAQTSPPAAPTGMRDVTPRPNTGAGTTTGAAPSQPSPPPAPIGPAPASK
jgi:hypothetical protein